MYKYSIDGTDGDYEILSNQGGELYHDLSVKPNGTTPVGTLTITAMKYGSDVFESVPDGVIDLSAPNSIQFTGGAYKYNFNLSGVSGINSVDITDMAQKV